MSDATVRLARKSTSGISDIASVTSRSIRVLGEFGGSAYDYPLGRVMGRTRPGNIRSTDVSAGRLPAIGWRPLVTLSADIAALLRDLQSRRCHLPICWVRVE